jgi:sec-independent protein translocase protein TatB
MEFISNFNGLELVFIVILAILLFGPEKIPEIAAKLGSWTRTLRRLTSQVMADIRAETGLSELADETSALGQTASEIRDTMQSIQSPAKSINESLNKEMESIDESRTTAQKTGVSSGVSSSATKRKQLEKRLQSLEKQLQDIRSELNEVDAESAEGGNE